MSKIVYIFGTYHCYQFGAGVNFGDISCSEDDERAFQSIICDSCKQFSIVTIAEEMSTSALQEQSVSESVPKRVANRLCLLHEYCDPTREEQERLGIREETTVEAYGKMIGMDNAKIEKEQLAERLKREPYWFDRLKKFDKWPVLFVCGWWHVPSFSDLLRNEGIQVEKLNSKWYP